MVVYHQVCVDLEFRCDIPPVRVVRGDTARTLGIMLLSGGAPWPVPEGVEVFIRYRNEQGGGGMYDTLPNGDRAWSANGNILTIALPPQVFAVPGNCTLQVIFLKDGIQLSTFEIVIFVEGELEDGEEPELYYNLSQWLSQNNNAYFVAVSNGFVGTVDQWLESLVGPEGPSAYQAWLNAGNTGTEAAFLASLKGHKGDPGPQGPRGSTGPQGVAGKSAYEVAVENGFTGTQTQWLESLGAVKNIRVSTDDLQAGVTALDTGTLYVVYE